MQSRALVTALTAGAALMIGITPGNASAAPIDSVSQEPVPVPAAANCGPAEQADQMLAGHVLWTYDTGVISCPDAIGVIARFIDVQEKYATVGDWECGVNGAAEVDRSGLLIRCDGRGTFITVEEHL